MSREIVHDMWVEVDLAALRNNLKWISSITGDSKIMAVVKANGYGHGYAEPAKAFIEAGAYALAVTHIDEALPIRETGITAPILLFAPIQPGNAEAAIEANLDMTVASVPLVKAISDAAVKLGKTARVHVKVDTGMCRLGITPESAVDFLREISSLPNIEIAGIYTHFATAAQGPFKRANAQMRVFEEVLQNLRREKIAYGLAHAANSAAISLMHRSHLDMVRPGTILYGQVPSSRVRRSPELKPTWKLKARVCAVKYIPKGCKVGYGAERTVKRLTKIAVVPIGFADGFTLVPEGPIYRQNPLKFILRKYRYQPMVSINGEKARVLGRVSMQMCVVDVTDLPGVEVGDEVIIPAMRIPTSPLIPRVYLDSES